MGSVYRGHDRFDDSRTSISSVRRGDGGYKTTTRYVVKDDDSRSSYTGRDRRLSERQPERVEETRIVRREVEREELPPRREEPRYAERELVIRRDRSEEPPRRQEWSGGYDRRRDEGEVTERELIIKRSETREEPRVRDDVRELTVSRFDERRDYRDDYLSPQRANFDDRDRDLQKYTRTAEYFSPPAPPPQVIVIKQEPIIIRERARDEDYQIVRKSDVDDERSVVKRDDRGRGREEEYFYEKKVKERIEEPRRDEREEDFYERKSMRREVSPGDSVSQAGGRGRDRSRGRDYSSDDSMVYVRKEVRETSEDGSPHHKKHLAEGIVAGIGAAELLRHHKKKEGRDTGGGLSRVGKDLGAGALGALAAEGISRARSVHRSRSRRRERSESRETRRDKGRHRSHSRKRSKSGSNSSRERLKTLGKYGLGAAALAAAAAYAKSRMDKNKENEAGGDDRRRSRSRRRHGSDDETVVDDARNPSHRNKRIAEAGAAGAVVAGLIERARSKSRSGKGERSHSRVRQALPVIAAGLGSAALAGVYEKNKAGKQTEAAEKEQRRARSRNRSRSRARETGMYPDGPPNQGAVSDPGLIEYGAGPMYGNNYGAGYYGQPQPREGFYNDQTAVVPAAAAGAGYGAQREIRSRSGSRRRASSHSSSSGDDRKQRRRRRHDEERAAVAGVGAAAAATEYERKKAEKRERKARKRAEQQQQQEYAPYDGTYQPPHQAFTPPPPQANDPYAAQSGFYPQSSQFAPPPGPQQYAAPHQPSTASGPFAPGTGYDPSSFPPPPTGGPPAPGYDAYASGANQNPYAPRGRGADENVSVAQPLAAFGVPLQSPMNNHMPNDRHHSVPDGLNGIPHAPSPPAIHLQPPSISGLSSSYQPPVQEIYTSPTDRTLRSSSVPPPLASAPRKSVQFSDTPLPPAHSTPERPASAEQPRRSHRKHGHAYEAGDDIDSTPNEHRRRSDPNAPSSRSAQPEPVDTSTRSRHHHHKRSRSQEPQSKASLVPDPDRRNRDGAASPASDQTIDLPPRFDKRGNKKPEPGEDPLAETLTGILKGRLFGNFVDGLFGPEGRAVKK